MSQYYTIHTIDGADSAKYQTLQTTTTSTVSSAIAARRILITTGNVAQSVQFGTAPGVTNSNGFVIPSNTSMIFNFKSGNKVAVISTAASQMSILDLD
jgi:hypothetical protein